MVKLCNIDSDCEINQICSNHICKKSRPYEACVASLSGDSCPDGFICHSKVKRCLPKLQKRDNVMCETDIDCSPEYYCRHNLCSKASGQGKFCSKKIKCARPLICHNGTQTCGYPCTRDA